MTTELNSSTQLLDSMRGVLFDLDGTLLDTLADIAQAANAVLQQHGFPVHPVPAYRQFVGEGVRVLLTRALPPESRHPSTLEACLQTMATEYPRHLNRSARPYPGIPELLSNLQQRRLRLAVLSNKPDEFTTRCVTEFFGDLFDPILGLSSERPRKPDPAGALEVARRWGIPPGRILYVGDSDTDMETARRAGMLAIGALWGYRDEAELRAKGAQVLIRQPLDLVGDTFERVDAPAPA